MRALRALLPLCLALAFTRPSSPITLYIAGDSTAAEKTADKRPETGWGEMLAQYFRSSEVRVANRALNGRSTRSFVSEGHWRAITDSLRPGDYVFIQFGHNDESPDKGDRYSPPEEFKANLGRMVREVRDRNAVPVLLTPVYRRKFDPDGRLQDTHGEYPALTRQVAASLGVPLIDMHRGSAEIIASYGADSSAKLFLQLEKGENPNYPNGVHDNTHFRPLGAELMARVAVEGIRRTIAPLATHLNGASPR